MREASQSLPSLQILSFEPERLKNSDYCADPRMKQTASPAYAPKRAPFRSHGKAGSEKRAWSGSAQAACRFSCSTSKRAPFFQRIKVMVAILRAKVRRAIEGFIPRASKAA